MKNVVIFYYYVAGLFVGNVSLVLERCSCIAVLMEKIKVERLFH